jgi:hypothetical protein
MNVYQTVQQLRIRIYGLVVVGIMIVEIRAGKTIHTLPAERAVSSTG